MGRHRRSAAGRAARSRATGGTGTDGSYAGGHDYHGYHDYAGGHDPYDAYARELYARARDSYAEGRGRRTDGGDSYARGHGSYAEGQGRYTDGRDSYAADRTGIGIAPYLNPEAYGATDERSSAYLYATDDDYARATNTVVLPTDRHTDGFTNSFAESFTGGFAEELTDAFDALTPVFTPGGGSRERGHRRKKKAATPVRTGLLGVSAAVALGTVAVAAGVVPGLDNYRLGGGTSTTGGGSVQAGGAPGNSASEQGGTSGSADGGGAGGSTASRDTHRTVSPTPSAPASSAPAQSTPPSTPSEKPKAPHSKKPHTTPTDKAPKSPKAPPKTSAPGKVSAQAAAQAEVLKLVNRERAKVGCTPLAANGSLTELAASFSLDMAARDFFDHTDPTGLTPWDRAAQVGITDLGGENIARGQTDPAAVMEAWMNSPGHRANILNCDYRTLGVGVHFGLGGPWWTQDFGY
ncbi:CAP domain-containing protein [Streptomyces sp. NPDC046805]|uniref:CAP domain-containing protein n=1 Tax=Streptomyces sp. NPDC046805 TaxID=3155134 RepID=UPI0033F1F676